MGHEHNDDSREVGPDARGTCVLVHRRGGLDASGRMRLDVTTVMLVGEHDIATTPEVLVMLDRAVAHRGVDIVVDLRRVTFMGADTLGAIMRTRSALALDGRRLLLHRASSAAKRVLDICEITYV